LIAIGFLNGVSEKVLIAIDNQGFAMAIFNTFEISAVVWIAAFIGVRLLLKAVSVPNASFLDLAVAMVASIAILAPVPSLSWVAISGVSAYLIFRARAPGPTLQAATILLAMTVPVFWACLLFAAVGNQILMVDALLVGWIVGTGSEGNTVALADGSGWLFIAASCSSLSNVSVAILCAVLFIVLSRKGWTIRGFAVTGLACGATILINVTRIALIGLDPDLYPIVHGENGAMAAGWLTLAAIVLICVIGNRTNALAHR